MCWIQPNIFDLQAGNRDPGGEKGQLPSRLERRKGPDSEVAGLSFSSHCLTRG